MALKVNLQSDDGETVPNAYVRVEPRAVSKAQGLMTFAALAFRRDPTIGPAALAALAAPEMPAPLADDATGDQQAAHAAAMTDYEAAMVTYQTAEGAAAADLALRPFQVRDYACAYSLTAGNDYAQAYAHLTTLPAFDGAEGA